GRERLSGPHAELEVRRHHSAAEPGPEGACGAPKVTPDEVNAMNIPALLLSTGLSLLFLIVVFRPLEMAFPSRGQRLCRPAWLLDLCFLLGQYLLWSGVVLAVLTHVSRWLDVAVPSGFRAAVADQPWWLQAIEVVVLSDFLMYWGHRLQHRVGWL